MEEFLMKPKVDFAFKEIMTDKKARTGFLAAVLKINTEDIKETQILNTNLRKEHEDDKQGILDDRHFKLFPDEMEFYSCFHIREDTRDFIYTDKMEFHLNRIAKTSGKIERRQ